MNASIPEQALYLIEQIGHLIDESPTLEESYLTKLEKMETKMTFFLIEYHKHSALPLNEFASYLNHDALAQLTYILGYAELFRSVNAHLLSAAALETLDYICASTRQLTEDLRSERDFMVAARENL